jgi:hypothetical protein
VVDWKQATEATHAACIDAYYESGLSDEGKTEEADARRFLKELDRTLDGPFTVAALEALWDRLVAQGAETVDLEKRRPAVLRGR